jgi:hypothetical protein
MIPKRSYFIALSIFVILLVGNWLTACSSDGKDQDQAQTQTTAEPGLKEIDPSVYADWETFSHRRIRFHYPIAHEQMGSFEDMAVAFTKALERCGQFFHIPVPDTVDVYFYTGPGQAEEITGSVYPFVRDGVVHFTLPSYFGPPMAQLMIEKWAPVQPKFPFLREGAIALLDYSNQDYYQSTHDFVEHDSLIPLAALAQDTTVNSNKERYQSALAATFVDYFALRYGIGTFKMLYKTELPFDKTIPQLTGKSVDQVQHDWLRFVEGALLSLNQKDNSIIDSIVSQRGR